MTQIAATSSLSINGLCLSVFLGIYPEEKQKKQPVILDLHLRFAEPPSACNSDQLVDTYCYDRIIHYLKEKLADRRFQMIEKFTKTLYDLLKDYFPETVILSVRVTKKPKLPELTQGVTFEYGDSGSVWSS